MAAAIISTEQELRQIIKAPPGTVTAKIVSGRLRASPSEFLAAARLAIITVGGDPSRAFAVGGTDGFVTQDSSNGDLIVPVPATHLHDLAAGDSIAAVGMLMMVPGVKYTLRVNGTAKVGDDGESLLVTPDQSYAHCAKAFIRSSLWNGTSAESGTERIDTLTETLGALGDDAIEFIAASPFAVIGTSLVNTDADVSPRGDPPGFVQVIDDSHLFIPERPGNRIADSLRNIVANPAVSMLFIVPGDPRVLEVRGRAEVTTDAELCAAAEVNGKVPKLGVLVTVETAVLSHEPALDAGGAWDKTAHASEADLPSIGALVADPSGRRSIKKRAMAGITDRAVEFDYKRNLY